MIMKKREKKGKNQAIISINALGCANFFLIFVKLRRKFLAFG